MTVNKNNNNNAALLSLFSGQKRILTTPRPYVDITGCHTLAIILNQCVFWCDKSSFCDGEWFYKTYDDWLDEIHVPERTLRRKLDKLEEMGFIQTKVRKIKGVNTKHIKPDLEAIADAILSISTQNHPNRPKWPNGATSDQLGKNPTKVTCTNFAPTGQNGRLETAKVADSIYIDTDKDLQIKTTTNDLAVSGSSENSEKAKSELDSNSDLNRTDKFVAREKPFTKQQTQMLKYKCEDDKRTDEEFIAHCDHHVKHNSDSKNSPYMRNAMLLKLLKGLFETKEHFHSKGYKPPVDVEKQKAADEVRQKAQDEAHKKKMAEYQESIRRQKLTEKDRKKGVQHCGALLASLK